MGRHILIHQRTCQIFYNITILNHSFKVDQFYLVDSDYPNMTGFPVPYPGRIYYLRDYRRRGRPQKGLLNYRHSLFQNITKCCLGVLNARFPILKLIINYPLSRQR